MNKSKQSKIAVSLEYDPYQMGAPEVNVVAERLRVRDVISMARRWGIPIEDNSELASRLFELGEGASIPEELYQEIALLLKRID